MDNFSSPDLITRTQELPLVEELSEKSCKGMLGVSDNKIIKSKQGDKHGTIRGNLRAMFWKDPDTLDASDQRNSIRDHWSRNKQLTTPFPPQTMVHNHFLHMLKYLHFADNKNLPNKNSPTN
jgi:hypothetical protein